MTNVMPYAVQAVSTAEEYLPPLRGLVHGTHYPGYEAARYYIMDGSANDIPSPNWAAFEGCEDSGRLPKHYAEAALFEIDAEQLDVLHKSLGYAGVHAMGYAIGTTMMVGVMERRSRFNLDPEDSSKYVAAGGVGRGAVHLTAGIWDPAVRRLHVPHGSITARTKVPIDKVPAYATLL